MRATFEVILSFVAGYLVGSVPLGVVVSRVFGGIDIRRYGTGNMGAANVRENVGVLAGAIVALGVFLQGLAPPVIFRLLGGSEAMAASAAVGAVAGYGWPVFLRFRGGKGIGIATGAAAALAPGGFVVMVSTYALGALARQTSLGVLLGFVVYVAYTFGWTDSTSARVAAVLLLGIVVAKRMEGFGEDLRNGPFVPVFLNLLLFQRRPARGEEGRRKRAV